MIRKAKLLSLYCEYRLIYVSGHIFHGDASFTGSFAMKVALHFHCTRKKLNSRRILMYLRGLLLYVNFFYSQPVPCYHGNLSWCSGARDSDQLQTQDKKNKIKKCKAKKRA